MSRFLVLGALFFSLLLPVSAGADVTVFIYHRFGDDRHPSTNVGVEQFREQMAYLMANNYQVLPLAELVEMLQEGEALPERAAVITIDDGYRTVYTHAWPVLRSFGFPFTVFLYTKAVAEGYRDILTWDQIREMQAAGVDFQDHGYSHQRLANRPPDLDEQGHRAWIRADLTRSARILAEKLPEPPRFLALPYGEYDRIVLEEAKNLGYDAVFSQDPGSVSNHTPIFRIPREPILGNDWSTLAHFESVLQRVDLPATEPSPPLEPLTDLTPERFSIRLQEPERYQPSSLGIYVSELGWHPASLEGDLLFIENSATLTRRLNRVAVSGKEKETGRTAIRFWLLLKGEKQEPPAAERSSEPSAAGN